MCSCAPTRHGGTNQANEGQYSTVDDALTFSPRGGLATTLYNDGSNSAA